MFFPCHNLALDKYRKPLSSLVRWQMFHTPSRSVLCLCNAQVWSRRAALQQEETHTVKWIGSIGLFSLLLFPLHLPSISTPPPAPQSHSRGVMSSIWLTEYLSYHSENTLCKTSQCWGVICSRTPVSLCPPLGVSCAKCGLWSHKPVSRSTRLQNAPDPGPPRHWYNFIHGGMQLLYWPGAGKGTCKDTTSLESLCKTQPQKHPAEIK